MRNILFVLSFTLLFKAANGQALSYYTLETKSESYTELAGDTPVPQLVFASGDEYEIKGLYGETFNFYGKQWTMDTLTKGILIFPNAFIEVIEDSNFLICDALLRYLDSIDNTSKISYKIDGTGNKKILKVQWKNLKIRTGQPGNFVNVQIWVYQEHGLIEFRYGPSSSSNASGYIATTGPSVGISYSPFNFTPVFEKIWIYGTPPNIIIDSARNINFPNISGVPASGTVYRFLPKSLSITDKNGEVLFYISPNPAHNELVLSATQRLDETMSVSLLDMSGRLLNEFTWEAGTTQLLISTAHLPAGMYNVYLKSRNAESTIKVSVSH